jgi:hypothetical protein
VELVVHEEKDYGVGSGALFKSCLYIVIIISHSPAYWKGNSQSQSQGFNAEMSQQRTARQRRVNTRPSGSRAFVVDSNSEGEDVSPRKSDAVPSQATRVAPSDEDSSRVSQSHQAAQPLFLDSDEDIKTEFPADSDFLDEGVGELNDDAQTLQSSTLKTQEPSARQTRSSKGTATKRGSKKMPVIVDDESDDGATFKGFRGKRRGAH